MIPTPLFVRTTEYDGRPTWTVACRLPNGAIGTQSFWKDEVPAIDTNALDILDVAAGNAASSTWTLAHRVVTPQNADQLDPDALERLARRLRGAAMVLDTLAAAATEARGEGPFGDRSDEVLANVLGLAKDEADLTI